MSLSTFFPFLFMRTVIHLVIHYVFIHTVPQRSIFVFVSDAVKYKEESLMPLFSDISIWTTPSECDEVFSFISALWHFDIYPFALSSSLLRKHTCFTVYLSAVLVCEPRLLTRSFIGKMTKNENSVSIKKNPQVYFPRLVSQKATDFYCFQMYRF